MLGISRIKIASSWHDWRVQLAEDHAPIANKIYRAAFTLADGEETINVSKEDALARYDWKEGIDVILTTTHGTRMTLQEKFLTYWQSTVTFEETKTSGDPGAWYYCTAQYYFIGYTRQYWDFKKRKITDNPIIDFQDYMLIDLPALHRMDDKDLLHWKNDQNHNDRRRASFRYILFEDVPSNCVVYAAPQWSNFNGYTSTSYTLGE